MPKTSDKQQLLLELEETMKFAKMDEVLRDEDGSSTDEEEPLLDQDSTSSSEDDMLETPYGMAATLHYVVSNQRFLKRRRLLDRSRDYIYNYFLNQPDHEFKKITRVNRDTFERLVSLIESDPVFSNESHNKQAPIHWQLACALDRLGNDGQGVSHARSKLIWGIGQGTVHLYTRRVIRALCNLNDRFIQWPDPQERAQIGRRMAAKGFKDAVGFIDGTTIPLHKKPAVSGNVFMDRKKRYSMNAQIVCDDRYRIIYFKTGSPGSVHDSRAFNSTRLVREPHRAFSPGQYLLADSAYAATAFVVPSYKENQRDDRDDRDEPRKLEVFNTYLAKARIINEHTIGVFKARWACMKGMRVDIHEKEHVENFIHQAVACVVLHNFCLGSDPWDVEDFEDSDPEDEELNNDQPDVLPRRALSVGQRKRMDGVLPLQYAASMMEELENLQRLLDLQDLREQRLKNQNEYLQRVLQLETDNVIEKIDMLIAAKATIAEKEARIAELEKQTMAKDARIAELEKALIAKDAHVLVLSDIIRRGKQAEN